MKKSICLLFSGAIRECILDIRKNILDLKECFSNLDVTVIFFTWEPNESIPYDKKILQEQTDGIVDYLIFQKMKNIDEYSKTSDNNSTIQYYPIVDAAKFLVENNLKYDFVARCRHDNNLIISNVEKYLDGKFYIPLNYHFPHMIDSKEYTIAHFFITSYDNFIQYKKYDHNYMKIVSQNFLCTEHLDPYLMSQISDIEFIEDSDILKFRNRKFPGEGFMAREWK